MSGVGREALMLDCAGERLVAVVHTPETPPSLGVVIVVGGPQYRVGAHRQFVHLAEDLAAAGIAVLRFDYRGMGDSAGEFRGFEAVDDDIAAAVQALRVARPSVERVVLWGLCDAATAAAFYAARRGDVAGVVMANPWVRTAEGLARSYVKHYYGQRLLQRDFWRRLLTGQLPIARRLREFASDWRRARGRAAPAAPAELRADASRPLPERLRESLLACRVPQLLILSGQDLTAAEFADCLSRPEWRAVAAAPGLTRVELADADHTFSRGNARALVSAATLSWIGEALPQPPGVPPAAR